VEDIKRFRERTQKREKKQNPKTKERKREARGVEKVLTDKGGEG